MGHHFFTPHLHFLPPLPLLVIFMSLSLSLCLRLSQPWTMQRAIQTAAMATSSHVRRSPRKDPQGCFVSTKAEQLSENDLLCYELEGLNQENWMLTWLMWSSCDWENRGGGYLRSWFCSSTHVADVHIWWAWSQKCLQRKKLSVSCSSWLRRTVFTKLFKIGSSLYDTAFNIRKSIYR